MVDSINKLTKLVGTKGIEVLQSRNQVWKLPKDVLLDSSLVIAQTFKLKSLLETCSKYSGSPFYLDATLDINKVENSWVGKLITKSSTLEINSMDSNDLCSAVIALSTENVKSANEELVENVKILANNYKPKNVSVILKQSKFDCFVCKSQINLAIDNISLCNCLEPLQPSDVILTKSGEKVKLELSDNADASQLRFFIKLVTKSLMKD